MSLQLITPPSVEPVTLDEAKLHLKVDTTDDDALITRLISAARARAEWDTGRAFITQSWMLWLDCWPQSGVVEIPITPLKNVSAFTTYAPDGTPTDVPIGTYCIDFNSAPGRLAMENDVPPPVANLRAMNAMSVAFTAGYGDAADNVPAPVREAILEIIAELYVHRGDGPEDIPLSAQALLAPYRIFNF